ncbi:MAG: polymerase sigma70 factor [Bacilli bacterium]|jgi:RNA polymerase sigma-70 factor (ECF subfamily)|nr:polymerase sigma70 factor [Bacilli bacterium]
MDVNADFDYLKTMADTTDKKAIVVDLMTAYGDKVWNYAFSLTRKREQADDITQEVFLKVYRSLFTFRGESSIKTWLFTITRNTVHNYRRTAFFRKVTLVHYVDHNNTHRSAENEVMENIEISNIWQKVLQLPVKYREVLILFGHDQLSMQEISQVLGINEGTVKSRLHNARLKLLKLKGVEQIGSQLD